MIEQELLQVRRTFMADLDAYGSAIAACLELTFQRADEVTYLLLVDIQVTVARHAKLVATINLQAREQPFDVHANHRGQEYIVMAARAAEVFGKLNDPRQRSWCLHHTPVAPAPVGVAALEPDDEVETLVQHARERP